VNAVSNGLTPLMYAAQEPSLKIFAALLAAGAEVDRVTAGDRARDRGHTVIWRSSRPCCVPGRTRGSARRAR
jgi:hypothetical protein